MNHKVAINIYKYLCVNLFQRDFVHEYDKSKLHELLDHKAETDELKASTGFLQLGLICTHSSAKQRLEMFTVLTQIDAIIATQKITSRAQQNLRKSSFARVICTVAIIISCIDKILKLKKKT